RLSRMDLYLEFKRNLAENELGPLRDLVKRRGQGEPLQHLLGTVEFCGHTFAIDKRAMVPRPETEELVELLKSEVSLRPGGAYAPVGRQRSDFRMIDVVTGWSVIALRWAGQVADART